MATATEFLMRAQNPDGGWGYRAGGMSFVEPTACVLLACSDPNVRIESSITLARDRALAWLLSLQHPDGGWGVGAVDSESGWMTAWAVYALAQLSRQGTALDRGVEWLMASEGMRVTTEPERTVARDVYHMDPALNGFPWRPGDVAWVHPTAMALIALCAAGRAKTERCRQAVAFLLDRVVYGGGWNFGNPEIMRMQMAADVHDTAVVLLALAAAEESADPRIGQGLSFLNEATRNTDIVSELAWVSLVLGRYKVDASAALSSLAKSQNADGSWSGNPLTTAVALLAGARPDSGA